MRSEGLKVPQKQAKKGRLWLNDGSCVRLRPERPNHVWSYDFVEDRTHEGRKYRMLNVLDEFTLECLAIRVKRKLNSTKVIDALKAEGVKVGDPFDREIGGLADESAGQPVRVTGTVIGARLRFWRK